MSACHLCRLPTTFWGPPERTQSLDTRTWGHWEFHEKGRVYNWTELLECVEPVMRQNLQQIMAKHFKGILTPPSKILKKGVNRNTSGLKTTEGKICL